MTFAVCRRRAGSILRGAVIAAAVAFAPRPAAAQDPAPVEPTAIREIRVPRRELPDWLRRGTWTPLGRDDYVRLRAARRAAPQEPAPVGIRRADYTAVFTGEALREGTLEAIVARRAEADSTPRVLSLEPMSLALSSLRWPDGEAVWGTDRDGAMAMLIDRNDERLSGRWSLAGRRLAQGIEFDLHLLPAAISTLELTTPAGHMVTATRGDVLPPRPGETPGWLRWRIESGSRTQLRLTVTRAPESTEPVRPLLLSQHDVSWDVREDGMRMLATFDIEALEAPVSRLELSAPADLTIFRVTWGGEAAAWSVESNASSQRLIVALSEPLKGKLRPLRIEALGPPTIGPRWSPPILSVRDALFVQGLASLKVARPLEMRGLETSGLLQTGAVADPAEGQTVTFRQDVADARLSVEVRYPSLTVAARNVGTIEAADAHWVARSVIDFTARTGSTFAVRCAVAPGWEVIDVGTDENRPGAVASWDPRPQPDGSAQLHVEFREPLDAEGGQRVRATLRRLIANEATSLDVPVLKPLDCENVDTALAVAGGTFDGAAAGAPGLDRIAPESAPDFATSSPVWKVAVDAAAGPPLVLLSRDLLPVGRVTLRGGHRPEPAATTGANREDNAAPAAPLGAPAVVSGLPVAFVTLDSALNLARGDRDEHHMRLDLPATAAPVGLDFDIPTTIELLGVRIDGRAVVASSNGGTLSLPDLPAGESHMVEIAWRVASHPVLLRRRVEIAAPRCRCHVLGFSWRIAVPPEMSLLAPPEGQSMAEPAHRLSWRQRLFGPLGRAPDVPRFNPFLAESWKRSFASEIDETSAGRNRELDAPDGWSVYHASAQGMPETLGLELGHFGRARSLAWAAMLGVLLAGLVIRTLRWTVRGRAAAAVFSGCLVAAWVVPNPEALVLGGACLGTLLAIGWPRPLLPGQLWSTRRDPVPTGSTATFHHGGPSGPVAAVGALLLLAGGEAISQERPANGAAGELSAAVLIPGEADESTAPSDALPDVVYVSRDLADEWSARQLEGQKGPLCLVTAAEYRATVDRQNAVTIEARFRIAVPLANGEAPVRLPFGDANPGGARPCTVDGLVRPLATSPDGKGFVVVLPAWTPPENPASGPATAEIPPGEMTSDDRRPARVHEVVLTLNPPTTTVSPPAHQFQIDLLPAPSSRLELRTEASYPSIEVPGLRIAPSGAGDPIVVELGRRARLRVAWSAQAESSRAALQADARISHLVEVAPLWLQIRSRVSYAISRGVIDSLSWTLPRHTVVQKLSSDRALTWSLQPAGPDSSRLIVDFAESQTESFALDTSLATPSAGSASEVVIPPLIVVDDAARAAGVKVALRQVGVLPRPEYRLSSLVVENERIAPLAPDTFVRNMPGTDGGGRPQFAWLLGEPTAVRLALAPLFPVRSVRISQEGAIGPGELRWMANAEITTRSAPAFRHRLIVDPRLRIDSISVHEDQAERLVRWSRDGDRVNLTLSDKTAGTQDVVLRGRMEIDVPGETPLPLVRVEDSETVDSQLLLSRDASLDVSPVDPGALIALEAGGESPSSDGQVRFGRFRVAKVAGVAPTLRIGPRAKPLRLQTLSLIESESGSLRGRGAVRVEGVAPSMPPLRIAAGGLAALAPRVEVHPACPQQWKRGADGRAELEIDVSRAEPGTILIEWEGSPHPTAGSSPPTFHIADALRDGDLVAIAGEASIALSGNDVSAATRGELPEWAASLSWREAAVSAVLHRISGPNVAFASTGRPTDAGPRLLLSETQVRLDDTGESGRSLWIVSGLVDGRLEVDWPAGLSLLGLFVNGGLASAAPNEGTLRLETGDGPAVRVVIAFWRRDVPPTPLRVELSPPAPRGLPADEALLAVTPVPRVWGGVGGGLTGLLPVDYELARAEAWLAAAGRLSPRDESRASVWRELVAARDSAAAKLKSELGGRKPPAADAERPARLTRVSAEIERLGPSLAPDPPLPRLPGEMEADEAIAARLTTTPPGVEQFVAARLASPPHDPGSEGPVPSAARLWRVPAGWLRGLLAIVGCAAAAVVSLWLLRQGAEKWLPAHRASAWTLFGLLWWLWLAPSLAGLVLAAAGAVELARRRVRGERPSEIVV